MMSRLGKGLGYGTVPASRSSSVLVSAFLATVLYEYRYSYGGITYGTAKRDGARMRDDQRPQSR